jgi:membrane protein implicated in regulation of membrane protease activity
MIWIYTAAALFGAVFLVPMLLSGLDIGGGVDLDGGEIGADVEIDGFDVDGPELDGLDGGDGALVGADGGGAVADLGGGPLGAVFASLLSFRTVVFFTAFFGAAGLVLSWLDYSSIVTFLSSTLVGGFAGSANSVLFGLVKNSESTSQVTDRILQGRTAVVVLPMDGDHPGRIRIDLGGQPQYMVARPVDDGTEQQFDVGASVVVVEIENGTAMVTSLAELGLGEE